MPKIKDDIEQKIKASANIVDVVEDAGIQLHKSGVRYLALCPFHADRNTGSFVINERMNIYKCFACGARGDAIGFVMNYHNLGYRDALLYIAAIYGIYVEEDNRYKDMVAKRENYKKTFVPRKPMPPLKWMVWNIRIVEPYLHHESENPLICWMRSLPFTDQHRERFENMFAKYKVGTCVRLEKDGSKNVHYGWTVFPQIDDKNRVREMKLMAYKADGHRDKDRPAPWDPNKKYSTTWMSAMMKWAGTFDGDTYKTIKCLFGLHLMEEYKDAEICLVESEKTALLCSAFTDPTKRIWMAVGGLQFLTADMLDPLIKANRYIVLFPDADGRDKWQDVMDAIGYERMSMTGAMRPVSEGGQYDPIKDGPKADIADIMIRLMSDIPETEAEKVARMLGAYDKVEVLGDLMTKLDLTLEA